MTTRRSFLISSAALAAPLLAPAARAQQWPAKPIRAIVPFGAGSTIDVLGRLVLEPLATALGRITSDAARVLGVDAGHLTSGSVADVCIFDPNAHWTVKPEALRSQGKNTPYLGYELQGRVCYTIVDGQVVFEARGNNNKR